MAKYILPTLFTVVSLSLLSGCVTQSFENNEPIVKTQANRDEMAATRISLGLGYLKMGDMAQAKLNLEKAKTFSPQLVQVHTAFAHFYETVGESTLAVASFEQALSIKDDSADTLNNYGVFLCRQGKVAAAEVQFLKAIAVPSYLLVAQSYENLSSCYLQNDDFEKAEMYLNKAIFHSPNRTSTLLQMVRLQYAMADYKNAKLYLQKFERNTQRFTADSLALSYKVYRKLGQRRTASNYGNMLVKMYPQSWEGKQYLLNELEFIEADNLARKYKVTQKGKDQHLTSTSKKRVVKLSPNSKKSISSTNKVSKPKVATTSTNVGGDLISATLAGAAVAGSTVVATSATPLSGTTSVNTTASTLDTNTADLSKSKTSKSGTSNINTSTTKSTSSFTKPLVGGAVVATTIAEGSNATNAINTTDSTLIETKKPEPTTQLTSETVVIGAGSSIEPTSTQPIAAKRDVPLPEALAQDVEIETVTAAVTTPIISPEVVAEKTVNEEPIDNVVTAASAPAISENATSATSEIVEESQVPEEVVVLPEEDIKVVNIDDAFHTVEPGQNLYNISVKYNVKLNALRKWNDISEKNNIRIGDKLYVVDPQTVKNIND